ncbi:hypothetical protein Bra5_CH00865 [Rhizobium phaseoli Brasil 5]|nr:hypothetical protein Bra5_CH00865 [Rhizobium phaseoli Brasil 5]
MRAILCRASYVPAAQAFARLAPLLVFLSTQHAGNRRLAAIYLPPCEAKRGKSAEN